MAHPEMSHGDIKRAVKRRNRRAARKECREAVSGRYDDQGQKINLREQVDGEVETSSGEEEVE